MAILWCAIAVGFAPVQAARPLLDQHQWDSYFGLFAPEVSVPWKPATVRLDTYSGAPVDFAAYAADVADVIVAGANRPARPIDTARLQPVARWRFVPPPGYRFETSDVPLPLGEREGFFVIEARRDRATAQVWVNRSRFGLVTKESPESLLVWAVDLRSGRAFRGLRLEFLVGTSLIAKMTDETGMLVWRERSRPNFVLAQAGASRAFVSLLPQAPVPSALVGLRLETAVVRAGERFRLVGFARWRAGAQYRRASGEARITVSGRGRTIAAATAVLDGAGAFVADVPVPAPADGGTYTVTAAAGGGVGAASLQIEPAGDLALTIVPACPCAAASAIAVAITARRAGAAVPNQAVAVRIVRTPHVVPPGGSDENRWGATVVLETSVRTDADGRARIEIPAPTDELASTYGIRAAAGGAQAATRLVVPIAATALLIEPRAAVVGSGDAIEVDVHGFDPTDGAPRAGLAVRMRLSHGTALAEQTIRLDERGRARAGFRDPSLGSNLILAEANVDGHKVLDAAEVHVDPSIRTSAPGTDSGVAIALDRSRYRVGERIVITAVNPGSGGDALVTLEGIRTYRALISPLADGRARASLELAEALGNARVGVVVVRDGAVTYDATTLAIDAPGHRRATALMLDRASYAPGDVAKVAIVDGDLRGSATFVVRLTDGAPSGPAFFDDAPDVLATGGTTTQAPAGRDPAWHASVTPQRSGASYFQTENVQRRSPADLSIATAVPRTLLWRTERGELGTLSVPLPKERGRYVISVLKIADDGDVGAASIAASVQP